VLPTLLLSLTSVAEVNPSKFTLAIIKNATGTTDILKGKYQEGLTKLAKLKYRKDIKFNLATGNCVANIMLDKYDQAITFCDEAIETVDDDNYLKSVAHSNRGIARFKAGDVDGALVDLNLADQLDDNPIIDGNLDVLKLKMNPLMKVASE